MENMEEKQPQIPTQPLLPPFSSSSTHPPRNKRHIEWVILFNFASVFSFAISISLSLTNFYRLMCFH